MFLAKPGQAHCGAEDAGLSGDDPAMKPPWANIGQLCFYDSTANRTLGSY